MSPRLPSLSSHWKDSQTQKSCYIQGYALLEQNDTDQSQQRETSPRNGTFPGVLSEWSQMYSILPAICDNIKNICEVLTDGETHPSHGVFGLLVIEFLLGGAYLW